ncbi:MAG: hypothetical protein QUS11_04410 [Candidatus Fermentibacter sp.]|nr:hypothetical protein [Candidatus Fermentibacter sp.]
MDVPLLLALLASLSVGDSASVRVGPDAPAASATRPTEAYRPTAVAGVSSRRQTATQTIFSRSNGILVAYRARGGAVVPVILTTRHSVEGYDMVSMGIYSGSGPSDSVAVEIMRIPLDGIVFHPDPSIDLAAVVITDLWPEGGPSPESVGISSDMLLDGSAFTEGLGLEVMGRQVRGITLFGAGSVDVRSGLLTFIRNRTDPFFSDVSVLNGYSGSPVMAADGSGEPKVAGMVAARITLMERDGTRRGAGRSGNVLTEIVPSSCMLELLELAAGD